MQKSGRTELLEIVAKSEPIARKLREIERAQWPVQFSHVIEPAQAFLVATIASKIEQHDLGPLSQRPFPGIAL